MEKILKGTVVLDLTRFLSGPQCTLLLAGMGAEVIKIDDPLGGDPTVDSPPFVGANGVSLQRTSDEDVGIAYAKRARNKKSMQLNLKSEQGLELFKRMVKQADVVVENFSVGVTKRLGIDYESLKEWNPRLVYCSLTGYGSTGSDANLKAYDLMVQAASGLMSITGEPDGAPLKAGSPLSDGIAGVFAAMGVVSALYHRTKSNVGQAVDVSMVDCLFSLLFDEPLDCYRELGLAGRQGNRIMRFSPFNAYRSKDGWVTIGAATNADWLALLDVMGRQDLKDDPSMLKLGWRIAHNDAIDKLVGDWAREFDADELIAKLNAVSVPCSRVRTIDDVMEWPHLRERGMIAPVVHPLTKRETAVRAPGFPIKFSHTPAKYDVPAPIPGTHSDEMLKRFLGLSDTEIEGLKRSGVV
jgi:crotonobetainyl-CoA:carnitine CoA-transferase CaiB-like acyl-CoA transferase